MTEEGDVAYRIYTNEDDEEFDVVKRDRVDSHQLMEQGEVVCTRQTTCKRMIAFNFVELSALIITMNTDYVEFDNSFSYWRSKTLWYKIALS